MIYIAPISRIESEALSQLQQFRQE